MKLYIGCALPPFHPQHLQVLGNPEEWIWVDKYVKHPQIKNWDGMKLDEVEDGSVDEIYSSHTLEHFEHEQVPLVLERWFEKLKNGGKLTLNVPDLMWAMKLMQKLDQDALVDGYYNTFAGEHGVLSILFGSQSHPGEYHKGAFTEKYLKKLLIDASFFKVDVKHEEDAHDMGVLIATCQK